MLYHLSHHQSRSPSHHQHLSQHTHVQRYRNEVIFLKCPEPGCPHCSEHPVRGKARDEASSGGEEAGDGEEMSGEEGEMSGDEEEISGEEGEMSGDEISGDEGEISGEEGEMSEDVLFKFIL